jgi:hypothetical protein
MNARKRNIYLKSAGKIGGNITGTAKRGGALEMGRWVRIEYETMFGRVVNHTAFINDKKEIDDILVRYQGKPISITSINNDDD